MKLYGVFPPITTPFKDEELDLKAHRHNVERWSTTGLAGLVPLGSNGEAPLLDDDESDRIIAATREYAAPDLVVVAGAARESTKATIAACRRAAGHGADAVLVRTPSFFKAHMTADVLAVHYQAVADASPVPVILYNFPAVTGVNLRPETVARLAAHPNIVGVKESGGDLAHIGGLVDLTPEDFIVLVGSAPTFYPSLCMGADGGILALACVVPEACVELHRLTSAGRHGEARTLQRLVTPLARMVTSEYGVAGLKAAMDLNGYQGGEPRRPLQPLAPAMIERLREQLAVVQQPS